jgi:hypothetical protein
VTERSLPPVPAGASGMSRSDEYRQIAHECIEGARTSRSAEQRKQLLELAKMWMTAASMLDHGSERPALDDYVAEPATHVRSGQSGRAFRVGP